jgi:hypothetical protein
MKKFIAFSALLLSVVLTVSHASALVYAINGLIDVERMAVDKMYYDLYYDLYYNPKTRLFSQPDLRTLSDTATALIQQAEAAKIDRAVSADS